MIDSLKANVQRRQQQPQSFKLEIPSFFKDCPSNPLPRIITSPPKHSIIAPPGNGIGHWQTGNRDWTLAIRMTKSILLKQCKSLLQSQVGHALTNYHYKWTHNQRLHRPCATHQVDQHSLYVWITRTGAHEQSQIVTPHPTPPLNDCPVFCAVNHNDVDNHDVDIFLSLKSDARVDLCFQWPNVAP